MSDARSIDELRKQVLDAGIRPSRTSNSEDHLAAQIERLDRAQLTMERRLQDSQLSPVQRVRLQQKCDTLGAKADKLRAVMNQRVEDARFGMHAKDSHRALAARLRSFVSKHDTVDEGGNSQDAARVQRWLAIMIRERRAALDEIQERIHQARRYVLRATIQLNEVIPTEDGQTSADEIRTHVGMAEEAVRDARNDLVLLAHHWNELGALARRRDWNSLPFSRLKDELVSIAENPTKVSGTASESDADEAAPGPDEKQPDSAARLNALRDEFKATAIWLQELRTAVQTAPPPFNPSTSSQ